MTCLNLNLNLIRTPKEYEQRNPSDGKSTKRTVHVMPGGSAYSLRQLCSFMKLFLGGTDTIIYHVSHC